MSGFLLIISSLPVGATGFVQCVQDGWEWQWASLFAIGLALATLCTGTAFVAVGKRLAEK